MWRTANEGSIKKYRDGTGPDPALGTYWLAQAPGETLPSVND